MALGAACGWRADHPIGAAFDKRFVRTMFGIDDARLVSCLRAASRIAEKGETWTWLRTPAEELAGRDDLPTLEQIEVTRRAAEEGGKRISEIAARMTSSDVDAAIRDDLEELAVACAFTEILADKLTEAVTHSRSAAATPGNTEPMPPSEASAWGERIETVTERFAQCWMRRNKPSGLSDIITALAACADDG